uniref:Uncharacterized protein n=1 Tax=Amphimedon queenslandica TaxID=400682 RepID=A0A1X7VDH1_AMPQE
MVMDKGFLVFINTFDPEKSYLRVCIADWPSRDNFIPRLLAMAAISLETKRAPNTSNRGIVWACIGATLVLKASNLVIAISPILILKFTTALYATDDASQNRTS